MSRADGANPLRWDCARRGCFNVKKRPKIEQFADCLAGRIAFSDLDAITEICGNLLLLEWKEHTELAVGQRLLFERLTQLCPATVLIVEGDAEAMTVESLRTAYGGVISPPEPANLHLLRQRIREWNDWALRHPALAVPRPRHESSAPLARNDCEGATIP